MNQNLQATSISNTLYADRVAVLSDAVIADMVANLREWADKVRVNSTDINNLKNPHEEFYIGEWCISQNVSKKYLEPLCSRSVEFQLAYDYAQQILENKIIAMSLTSKVNHQFADKYLKTYFDWTPDEKKDSGKVIIIEYGHRSGPRKITAGAVRDIDGRVAE